MIIDLLREKMRSSERRRLFVAVAVCSCAQVCNPPENDLLLADLCFSRCAANSPGKKSVQSLFFFLQREFHHFFYLLTRTKYTHKKSKCKKKEKTQKRTRSPLTPGVPHSPLSPCQGVKKNIRNESSASITLKCGACAIPSEHLIWEQRRSRKQNQMPG